MVPENGEVLKSEEGMSKGPRSQLERAPNSQIWVTLSKERITSMDYNPLNKINIHESINN